MTGFADGIKNQRHPDVLARRASKAAVAFLKKNRPVSTRAGSHYVAEWDG